MFRKRLLKPPSLENIFAFTAFVLGLAPIFDPDFFWHIRTGQEILASGRIPAFDTFSWSFAGQEWFAHSWLADVIFYAAFSVSPLAVVFLKASLGALCVRVLSALLARRHHLVRTFFMMAFVLFTVQHLNARPFIFTYLFFAALLWLIFSYLDEGKKWILVTPVLMMLWVNMHAGAVMGLGLFGLALTGVLVTPGYRAKAPLLLCVITASTLAMLINPAGPGYFEYVFQYVGGSYHKQFIQEWAAPDFHTEVLIEVLLIGLVMVPVISEKVKKHYLWVMLLPFIHFALQSLRSTYFLAAVAGAVMWRMYSEGREDQPPSGFDRVLEKTSRPGGGVITAGAALLVMIFIAVLPEGAACPYVSRLKTPASPAEFPIQAVAAIRAGVKDLSPQTRLFNEYGWGGYLIWQFKGIPRVYIDGRADMYGADFIRQFKKFLYVSDAEGLRKFEAEGFDMVLIRPNRPLAKTLENDPFWKTVYRDKTAAVFVPVFETGQNEKGPGKKIPASKEDQVIGSDAGA